MNRPADAVLLHPLESSHHKAWLSLWQGYQAFYKVNIAASVSRVTWERLLDPHEPMHGALAMAGGDAVGLIHWIMHRSCWTTGDYCYLQDLFVSPAARGQGQGGG
jgi:GNAT superfamily N-acetyltransferase